MGIRQWERVIRSQADLVDELCEKFSLDLWALAKEKPLRKYKKSDKILDRNG